MTKRELTNMLLSLSKSDLIRFAKLLQSVIVEEPKMISAEEAGKMIHRSGRWMRANADYFPHKKAEGDKGRYFFIESQVIPNYNYYFVKI